MSYAPVSQTPYTHFLGKRLPFFLKVFLSPSVVEALCFSLTKKICTGGIVFQGRLKKRIFKKKFFCKCLFCKCSHHKIKGELHLLVKLMSLLVSTAGPSEHSQLQIKTDGVLLKN